MKNWISLFGVLLAFQVAAQQKIDTVFSFQSDPAKKLSLYIPSLYSHSVSSPLMVGLHPFNTSRWNAKSWRDTLVAFAENNGFILLCPDGGNDGRIDDPIDTAFTSAMMDSVLKWYNIDVKRIYCMGFSWGGKTTYTYGLSNPSRFCGYFPYGAAVNVREVSPNSHNIKNKPIYILHGNNDAPSSRFTPLRNLMVSKGGWVRSKLLSGVGHTVDFANRNQEFDLAYHYLDSVCNQNSTTPLVELDKNYPLQVFPNPSRVNSIIHLRFSDESIISKMAVYNHSGKLIVQKVISGNEAQITLPNPGVYEVVLTGSNQKYLHRLVVQ